MLLRLRRPPTSPPKAATTPPKGYPSYRLDLCCGSLPGMNLGTPELLVILVIVLLVFGGARLPKLARSLGQAQKEFKEGLTEADEEETS